MEKVFTYTISDEELFENIFKSDKMLINHVVIPPGKFFPGHPTDAEVCILIVRGALSVAVGGGEALTYVPGQMLNIPKGTLSELGNGSGAVVELFVIKTEYEVK